LVDAGGVSLNREPADEEFLWHRFNF
jgi:hypothetical protein